MKRKLKKLAVLAVVLAAGTFWQVGNAQRTIDDPVLGFDGPQPIYKCTYTTTSSGSINVDCVFPGSACSNVRQCL